MSETGPTLVPSFDVTVHLVLDDFGKFGRAYVETDEEKADRGAIVHNLLVGEYTRPLRVVAFNTAEFWSRDVSEDIAWEVVHRAAAEGLRLPDPTFNFVARHLGSQVALRAENGFL